MRSLYKHVILANIIQKYRQGFRFVLSLQSKY